MADRLYPADLRERSAPQPPPASAAMSNDTSRDEHIARELQKEFDRSAVGPVLAVPVLQVPYSCGACGTTHSVRNVTHGAVFTCTVCGAENRILLQQHRQPVVVVHQDSAYPLPIPIFCSIL